LDAVAKWFEKEGYPVVRAPTGAVALGYCSYWYQRDTVAYLRTLRDPAQRAYNNVLVETYMDSADRVHRTVYMPRYGITPVENRLVEIYNRLGYRIVFIPYMWEPAWGRGAVDCLTSEVRGPFVQPRG
jgi:hypothetical protein